MLEKITRRIEQLIEGRDPFGFDIRFDLGETGNIFVAGRESPIRVLNSAGAADTVFKVSAENLCAMLDGDLAPMSAYVTGKLKVEGDIGRAMQLSSLFG